MSIPAQQMIGVRSPATGFGPGDYITDGTGLYRLLEPVSGGRDDLVCVEECRSLDAMLVPAGALADDRLRLVAQGAA